MTTAKTPSAIAAACAASLACWAGDAVSQAAAPPGARRIAPRAAGAANGPVPSYFRRSREGWFWYEDPEPEAPPPPPQRPAPAPVPMTQQERDLAAFKDFQFRFVRSLNAATINPSQENVALFLTLYAQARRKASVFADQAQTMSVTMPWLDETIASGGRPAQPSATRAYDSIRMQDRDQLLMEMAQSYGLYFFFRASCAYCHVQAPLLQVFQQKYGFTVFAVSMDGSTMEQFPDAMRNTGLAESVASAIGVPMQHFSTPAMVLARPSTGQVVPIGFGVMSVDELSDRIARVVRVRDHGPGSAAPTQIRALTGAAPTVTPPRPSQLAAAGGDDAARR